MAITGRQAYAGEGTQARWRLRLVVAILGLGVILLRWGGYVLIADDPLPAHVEAAIVLQGSVRGVNARIAGAVESLRQDLADTLLVSVPRESYWGQAVPPIARAYIATKYPDVANRIEFCETPEQVNSTREEIDRLLDCVQDHGWHSVLVVTSDYHTRRARLLFRRALRKHSLAVQITIHGVGDQDFQARQWWRKRLYAKTWFLEITKLVWDSLFGF